MATHSSILPWRIPWTEEPGRLQFIGLQGVGHDWATNIFTFRYQEMLKEGPISKLQSRSLLTSKGKTQWAILLGCIWLQNCQVAPKPPLPWSPPFFPQPQVFLPSLSFHQIFIILIEWDSLLGDATTHLWPPTVSKALSCRSYEDTKNTVTPLRFLESSRQPCLWIVMLAPADVSPRPMSSTSLQVPCR